MGCLQPSVQAWERAAHHVARFVARATCRLWGLLWRWTGRRHRPFGTLAVVAAVATAAAWWPQPAGAAPRVVVRVGSTQSVGAFKAWARAHVGARQFRPLNKIWMHESGWNRYARNPASGAYGIPQALPAGKLRHAGRDWSWDGYTQMRWGLHYIRSRYGSPARAWHFWNTHHWY